MTNINDYPWDILNVDHVPSDIREVKRAYARQLKQIDRSNVDEFQQLQNAYQYALMITSDKPAKATIRSMDFSEDSQEPSLEQPSLKDLILTDDDEMPSENLQAQELSNPTEEAYETPSLKDLTFTYEAIEEDENEDEGEFEKTQKYSKAPNIYDELADPKNLTLKKWQEILNKADLDNLKEKSKIELHILTILNDYVVNTGGTLQFNNKMPRNLVAYIKDRFDFEKHHQYHDQDITNVLLAFSAKYKRPYLTYAHQFILYTFGFLIIPISGFTGKQKNALALLILIWAVKLIGLKIIQSRFKAVFNYLAHLAIVIYLGKILILVNSPTNNSTLAFIIFWIFTKVTLFSISHFPNKTYFFHMNFSLFYGWHLALIVLTLPKLIRALFTEIPTNMPTYAVVYTILTTIVYGGYFILKKEPSQA